MPSSNCGSINKKCLARGKRSQSLGHSPGVAGINGMLMLTNGFFFFIFVEPRRAPASKNAQNGMKYKVGADFLSSTECLSVTVVSDDYTL